MKRFQIIFYLVLIILNCFKAEEKPEKNLDENSISDDEFIKIMNSQEKIVANSEVAKKMELMTEKAMNSLYFMNKELYKADVVRKWMYILTGQEPDPNLKVYTPFYTDCGKNIHLGKNIIINSGCNFQDQGGIYIGDNTIIEKNVVMKTINYDLNPKTRGDMWPKPIHIGKMFGLELELLYYLVSILVIILLLLLEVLLLKMFLKIRFMEEILLNL